MANDQLMLNISKINISPDQTRLKYSQDERGKQVDVTIIDNDGTTPFDLTGKKIIFSETKQGNAIIIDGHDEHYSNKDLKNGKFTYTFVDETFQKSGEAHFTLETDSEHVDTTLNFPIDIVESAQMAPANTSYLSNMADLEADYKATINDAQASTDALKQQLIDAMNKAIANGNQKEADALADAKNKLQALQDATDKINSDWTAELNIQKQNFTDLQSQWQAQTTQINSDYQTQKKAIQDAADKQLADNKTAGQAAIDKINSDRDDAIKALNDKRDQAIATANTNFQNKLNDIQSDYNDWKTKTIADFTNKVNDLENRVTAAGTKQTELEAAIKSAQDAVANIKNVDWAKYATKDDLDNYYDKADVDSKTSGTIVTGYDVASKNPTTVKNSYTNEELVDQGVLGQFADQINQLKGRRTVNQPDFNALTDGGSYYITNPSNGKNSPTESWGNLLVSNGDGHRRSQLYFPDDGSALYMRELDETTWHGWIQLATTAQVNVDGPLFKHLTQFNNWGDLFDGYSVNGFTPTNGNRLVAFRDDTSGGNTVGNNSAGIGFGGGDTKGVLSVEYGDHIARIAGGDGDKPVWSEDIAWKSDITTTNKTVASLSDNVATDEGKITTNTNDIKTLQGQQTQTAADVASIKKAVGSGAIAQVKQYTEEQEVQALKDSASGNVLGVFFS